jgi:hypothetical protein
MADDLLNVLSQRRELGWPAFRRLVEELALRRPEAVERRFHATNTLHSLKALGHVTATFAERPGRVSAAPRVLARLPRLGPPWAVLCGHRLPDTEGLVRAACARRVARTLAEDQDGDLPLLPRRLLVVARSDDDLAWIAGQVQARFTPEPAAWNLLQFAAGLDAYLTGLEWVEGRDPDWPCRRFDPMRLDFLDDAPDGDGLHALTDPRTGVTVHRLRRGRRMAWVDRDWGRYAALREAGLSCLRVTPGEEVAVPGGALPPGLFAAVLGTCSGYAPVFLPEALPGGCYAYRGVPQVIARGVADKLGQTLLPLDRCLTKGPAPCPT